MAILTFFIVGKLFAFLLNIADRAQFGLGAGISKLSLDEDFNEMDFSNSIRPRITVLVFVSHRR